MAHEKDDPKKPASAAAGRTKRPTTIDLKATELKPEPAKDQQPAAAAPPRPEPAAAEAASSDTPKDMPQGAPRDTPKEAPKSAAPNTGRAAESTSPPDAGRAVHGGSKDFPWPLIGVAAAAAIVFFAVGLGAGQWLSSRTPPQPASAPVPVTAAPSPELLARLDKLETQVSAPRTEDPQLQSRLAKLEAQVGAPRANDQQLIARIAAAEAAVKTLADLTAAREKRSDDIAALARDARERASSAVSAAEAAQKTQTASPEARADLDALTTRIATLEKSAQTSQAELARRLTADDAKGRFAISAIALRDAVDSGMPFAAELAAVKSLSGDAATVAALEPFAASGLPSTEALGRELAGLMPAIWKAARKEEPQQGTFIERLQSNAERIVRIRPAGDVAGDDPASIRSRIEARAGNADIRGALAELSKLPPDARAPAAAWIRKAEARNAAIAAARNISQTALGALVKPGS
jgi:hypothetical protein